MKKQKPCTFAEVVNGRRVRTTEDVANVSLELADFLLNLKPCEAEKKEAENGKNE